MPNAEEMAQLRQHIAVLEGRIDALSNVLHTSIIMTEDVLKRHQESIVDLLGTRAENHPNPHAADVLREWVNMLSKN